MLGRTIRANWRLSIGLDDCVSPRVRPGQPVQLERVDVLREFGPDVNPRMLASAFVFAKKAAMGAWERLDNGGVMPNDTPGQVPNGVMIYQNLLDYTRVWFPELFDVASAHAAKMLTGDASVPTNAEGFVRHMFILFPNGPPGTKSDVPL